MKRTLMILTTMLTIISNSKGQPEAIWQLLQNGDIIRWAYSFGDEFNGTELDYSKWDDCFEFGCDQNAPNGYFKRGPSHHIFDNGILKLVTKYEPDYYEIWHWDNNGNFYTTQEYRQYTSGMIVAKQKFKYGLFEIRFKLPAGKGLFPAFWLYGGNPDEEFDIFEYKGETPNKIHINVHHNGIMEPNVWVTANGNFSDGFNNMMGEWGPNACFWYLNGQEFAIWLGNLNYQEFLIANMGVANDCPDPFCPGPDNTTPLPAYFEIDYIRVWTRLDCEQVINICNYSQSATDPTAITGQQITMGGSNCNATIHGGQSLKLIATDNIVLKPGFHAEAGSDFHAKLVACPGPQKSLEQNQNSDSTLQIISEVIPDRVSVNDKVSSCIENPSLLYTKIYPNPTEGKITVEFVGKTERNIKIELLNSIGELVFSKDNITSSIIDIDISHLPNGVYVLKGTFGINSVSEKIILK